MRFSHHVNPARRSQRAVSIVLFLSLTAVARLPAQEPPPTLAMPNAEETKQALEAVQQALVDELKLERHLGPDSRLAYQLGKLKGEDLGEFFGNVAAGDEDAAFNSLGRIGANIGKNYLVDDLTRKWENDVDFQGKHLLKYLPANPDQCRQIVIQLWRGNGGQALLHAEDMLRKESMKSLEQMSRDAISGSIDWVLEETLGFGESIGKSPGALFLQLVEFEIWMIEVADRYQDKVLLNKLGPAQEFYNQRRRTHGPEDAFNALQDRAELEVFSHVLYEKHKDLPALLESRFLQTTEGEKVRLRLEQAARQAREEVVEETRQKLREEVQRIQQLIRQKLRDMADSDDVVRRLHEVSSQIQLELARMEAATQLMNGRGHVLRSLYSSMVAIGRDVRDLDDLRNRTAENDQDSLEGIIARTSDATTHVNRWRDSLDKLTDQTRTLRSEGRRLSQRVQEFCRQTDAAAATRQGSALELIKEIRNVAVTSEQAWNRTHRDALAQLASIRSFQLSARQFEDMNQNFESLVNDLARLNEQLESSRSSTEDAETLYDVSAARCVNLIASLRKALSQKSGDKLACELRKQSLDDDMDGFAGTTGLRQEIAEALAKCDELLTGLEPELKQVQILSERLEKWSRDAEVPLTFDVAVSMDDVRSEQLRFEKYLNGLHTLVRAVQQCAQLDPAEVTRADLAEAERLLREAREHGGKMLDAWIELEDRLNRLQQTAQALVSFQERAAAISAGLPASLAGCGGAQQTEANADPVLQAAAVAANDALLRLQQQYEAAVGLAGLLRTLQESVSQANDAAHCENLHGSAERTLQLLEAAVRQGLAATNALDAIFQTHHENGNYAPAGQRLNAAQEMLTTLLEFVPQCRATVSRSSAASLRSLSTELQQNWSNMKQHGHEAEWRIARITSLLRPHISGSQLARELQANADRVAETVSARLREAEPLVTRAAEFTPAAVAAHSTLLRILPELHAALARLQQCCSAAQGTPLVQLQQYASQAAARSSVLRQLQTEGQNIVASILAYCQTRFPEQPSPDAVPDSNTTADDPGDISDLFTGNDRTPADDAMQETPPDLSDLIAGVERPGANEPPDSPLPQPPDQPLSMDGTYQLTRVASRAGERQPIPVLLRWQTESETEASVALEVSQLASAEVRADLRELGIPERITMTAVSRDGVFVVDDPNFRSLMRKVVTALAQIGIAVGDTLVGLASLGAVEPDPFLEVDIHTAQMRVTPGPANNITVDLIVDFTMRTSSGPDRQSGRMRCIGLRQ